MKIHTHAHAFTCTHGWTIETLSHIPAHTHRHTSEERKIHIHNYSCCCCGWYSTRVCTFNGCMYVYASVNALCIFEWKRTNRTYKSKRAKATEREREKEKEQATANTNESENETTEFFEVLLLLSWLIRFNERTKQIALYIKTKL